MHSRSWLIHKDIQWLAANQDSNLKKYVDKALCMRYFHIKLKKCARNYYAWQHATLQCKSHDLMLPSCHGSAPSNVAMKVPQDAATRQPVSPSPTYLLMIPLDCRWRTQMPDEAHILLINPHAERHSGYDNLYVATLPLRNWLSTLL